MYVYAMYDVAANHFGNIFNLPSADVARRHLLSTLMSGEKSQIVDFPDDFVLYELGEYEDTVGFIKCHPAPIKVITGFEAVNLVKQHYEKLRKEVSQNDDREQNTNSVESVDCVG